MHPPIRRATHNYPSETSFMLAFHEGARDAFKYIYDDMHPALTRYLKDHLPNPADAEDICSAVFLKLYLHRDKIENIGHIRRWLYVVAHNAAICFLRKRKRDTRIHREIYYLAPRTYARTSEPDESPFHLKENLSHCVNRLPHQQKAIIRLYFFECRTTYEIAQHMELSPQTVLNHKTKALDKLRRTIASKDVLLQVSLYPA